MLIIIMTILVLFINLGELIRDGKNDRTWNEHLCIGVNE
jgi:hypothetical protein